MYKLSIIEIKKPDDTTGVLLLLKNKDGSGFQFVNLTKSHICPCKFATAEEAFQDLDKYISEGKIKGFNVIGD